MSSAPGTRSMDRAPRARSMDRSMDARHSFCRAWYQSWLRAHVMLFWFVVSLFERLNDGLFAVFIRFATMRARSKETIHQAVARCDVAKVDRLARSGDALLHSVDATRRTPLHVALDRMADVAEEDADEEDEAVAELVSAYMVMVRCLLNHRADISARDAQERAPIHVAVKAGLHEVARSLIDAGADPTLLVRGASTLLQAVRRRDAKMTMLLLHASKSRGLDCAVPPDKYVNVEGPDGWSALGLAARAGDAVIVKALLDAGAAREAVMKSGKTALDIARLNRRDAVVRLLE